LSHESVSAKDLKREQLNATVYREQPANQSRDKNTRVSRLLLHYSTGLTEQHMEQYIVNKFIK